MYEVLNSEPLLSRRDLREPPPQLGGGAERGEAGEARRAGANQAGHGGRTTRRLFAAITLALAATASAQPDGLLCGYRDQICRFDGAGGVRGVCVEGDLAYLALDEDALGVLDISDPAEPGLLATLPITAPRAVATRDGYAYVAAKGFFVVDVHDPLAPILVGQGYTGQDSFSLLLRDNLAFVSHARGLTIFDISDPSAPDRVTGLFFDQTNVYGIALLGDIALVAAGNKDLYVLDISDPATPLVVTTLEFPGNVDWVCAEGDRAYIARGQYGVSVLDVSDPAAPVPIAEYVEGVDGATGVTVSGSRLHVLDWDAGIRVLDVSDHQNILPIGGYSIAGVPANALLQDGRAYVCDRLWGLHIFDAASPPRSPRLAAIHGAPDKHLVAEHDGYAFVAAGGYDLAVYDIHDPGDPVLVQRYLHGEFGEFDAIIANGPTLYCTDYTFSRLRIIDASDPTQLVLLSSTYSGQGSAYSNLTLRDTTLFAAAARGLDILDVSDPASPLLLGVCTTPGYGVDVAVRGDYAYLADYQHGFAVIDISDPTDPRIVSENSDVSTYCVDVAGDIMAVGRLWDGIDIYELADPAAPRLLSTFTPLRSAKDLHIRGTRLYVGADTEGLTVIDIADPSNPRFAAVHTTETSTEQFCLAGDLALAGGWSGYEILSIADCPCLADANGDGVIDSRDFVAYLNAWATERARDCSAGDCLADLDHDGSVDTQDFIAFLDAWATGC